jgi:hypothetical protein
MIHWIKATIHNTLAIYYRWRSNRIITDWFKSGKYLEYPEINIFTEQFKTGGKDMKIAWWGEDELEIVDSLNNIINNA